MHAQANELLRDVHDRMPVILHAEDYKLWLEDDIREQGLRKELLCPYPAPEMMAYPVSTLVNSPQNHGADLIAPQRGES
jgi:putative SOS response-associated peptidase YedK